MPPSIDATVSTFGAYEPTRLTRIGTALAAVNPRLWGLLASAVMGAAAYWWPQGWTP